MRPPRSLAGRLFLGAAVWLAVAMVVGGVVLAEAFRESVERGFEQRLEPMLRTIVSHATVAADGSVRVVSRGAEPRFEELYSGLYWQVSDAAGPVARSRSLWDFAFPVEVGPAGGGVHVRSAVGPRGEPVLVVERDLSFPQRETPLHFLVAADRADIDREVAHFRLLLGLALGGLGAGLLVAVAAQVRYGMLPLRRLAEDLARLRGGGGARLGGDYPSEIQPLVEATNKVLDHDAALIERARTHVGNLAHALKTPLAILKAESAARGGDAIIDAQVGTMGRLVEVHLARARAIAGTAAPLGLATPVAAVAENLAAMMETLFAGKHLMVECRLPPDAVAEVDQDDLAEMLGNLMENAGKHARGRIAVSCRVDNRLLLLRVEDDGPGMTEAEAELASRRGTRLDESLPGWGLGLSITADLAALHGGALHFGRSQLGGLAVDLVLPGGMTNG